MRVLNTLAVAVALVAFSGVAGANDVVLAQVASKSQESVSLDIVSDGNATGFQFALPLSKTARGSSAKAMDLSKCLSDLPKTHQGRCVYREKTNDIFVIAFSLDNALLPEGVVGLGTISLGGMSEKSIKPANVIFASPAGKKLN